MSNAISKILSKYGENTVSIIRGNMARAGQNATGNTSASIQSEMIADNRVQVTAPSYVYVLETGRKPYQGGANANLKSKLLQWIRAKSVRFEGMTEKETLNAIYYTIQNKGTKLFRQGGRDDIITPALSDERIEKVLKEIADLQTKVFADVFDS